MNNEITSTHEMAETEWDGEGEPQDVAVDMVATKEPESKGIEFHVSMRDYTQRAMEDLIIEAAAMSIVGKFGERTVAKEIEAKALEIIQDRIGKRLETVTAEIIDQPMVPAFGAKEPVTMREFIGLYGREYLTQTVDTDGKAAPRDNWGNKVTRAEWFARRHMDSAFKSEIEKATSVAINQIRAEMSAKHAALIAEQIERFKTAMAALANQPIVSLKS